MEQDEWKLLSEEIETKIQKTKVMMEPDLNDVRQVKNLIFQKTSKVFVHNLKKLIQLETTQRNLARKIGVSEDLLSKYKAGEAFPSIETLVYICEYYGVDLADFLAVPLTVVDVERMAKEQVEEQDMFEESYFVYFFVTNKAREKSLHEGVLNIVNGGVTFRILFEGETVKAFNGRYRMTSKIVFFELRGNKGCDDSLYINLIRPNINMDNYLGGLGLMLLPSNAGSKPCAQKVLVSRKRIDREMYYDKLCELLDIGVNIERYGNVKLSQQEDEDAYTFIMELS